jgi:hypothetical protein
MSDVQIVGATPAQFAELKKKAAELEAKSREVSQLVLRRMSWWAAVRNVAAQYDLNLESVLGSDVVMLNRQADEGARPLLEMLLALDMGVAEIVGVQLGNNITMGVIRKGEITSPTGFPVLAYILIGTAAALGAKGLFTLDAWLAIEHEHALNQRAQIGNTAKKLELVDKAQAAGQLDQLDPILKQIDLADAKAQKTIIDSVTDKVSSFASGVGKVAAGGIGLGVIALLAFLLLSSKRSA